MPLPPPTNGGSGTGPTGNVSGCFLWFAANYIGATGTNGYAITAWQDLSGSGNSVTYPSASSTTYFPTYYSGVINGWPAVFFNGIQNGLTTKTNNSSLNNASASVTLFTVYSANTLAEQTIHSCDNNVDRNSAFGLSVNGDVTTNPSGWGFWYGKGGAGGNNGAFQVQASSTVNGFQVASTGTFYLRTDRFTNGVFEFEQYGVPIATGVATTHSSTNNTYNIGYDNTFGNFFHGYVAEIVGYNTELSDSDTALVNNYLMNKYFPASPPITPTYGPSSLSGLIAWYKASSIGLSQGGAPVTYWRDDSGSGNNCSVSLSLSGSWVFPTYQPNQINGWPTVRFINGGYFSFLQTNPATSYLPISSGQITSFCVFNTIDASTKQSIYNILDTNQNNAFNIGINNVPQDFYYDYGYRGSTTISASSTTFGTNLLSANSFMIRHDRFRQSDGLFMFGRYGADVASGISTTYNLANPTFLNIGYSASEGLAFYGDMAEIILYNRQLTELEVESVNSYLLQKYMPGNVGAVPLFIYGDSSSGVYKDIPLYTAGEASGISHGISLYTGSSALSFSGIPVYMSGVGFSSLGTTLFTPGSLQQYPPITLFVDGGGFSTSGVPLYISSSQFNTNTTTLYISGATQVELSSNTMPLYLLNIPTPSTTGQIPLFLSNSMSTSGGGSGVYTSMPLYLEAGAWLATLPLFVGAGQLPGSPALGEMPLYVYNPGSTGYQQGSITLFVDNSVQVVNNHKKMYTVGSGKLKGGLPLQGSMNLTISGS